MCYKVEEACLYQCMALALIALATLTELLFPNRYIQLVRAVHVYVVADSNFRFAFRLRYPGPFAEASSDSCYKLKARHLRAWRSL